MKKNAVPEQKNLISRDGFTGRVKNIIGRILRYSDIDEERRVPFVFAKTRKKAA